MHDIRKPYTRSSYNHDLQSRVEQFESHSYDDERDDTYANDDPVQIPTRRVRRDIHQMDMYPRRRRTDYIDDNEEVEEHSRNRRDDQEYRDTPPKRIRREGSAGTWIFIVTVSVLAIGALLMTYIFDSATITIVPKYKDISDFSKTITFTQDASNSIDIPFMVATSTISKSKTLPMSESKQVQSKASGKITIYNNFSTASQKLIKNTRFESTAGKIYRINESVTVPGMVDEKPGTLEVTVYADSYGTSYNTGPTEFTIPGFKGTIREKGFYARSKEAITGGASGNVSSVTLSDLNAAKDELAIELAQQVKADLIKVTKEGYVGLYGAIEIGYTDNENEILKGGIADYKVTATGYLMLADENKLSQYIAKNSIPDYANDPLRLGYAETMTYTRKDTDHISNSSTLSILVAGKPRIIWANDADEIKDMMRGKKRSDFKQIMKSVNGVESAEISFSPLWLSNFPTDTGKIKIVESLPKR